MARTSSKPVVLRVDAETDLAVKRAMHALNTTNRSLAIRTLICAGVGRLAEYDIDLLKFHYREGYAAGSNAVTSTIMSNIQNILQSTQCGVENDFALKSAEVEYEGDE